MALRGTYATGFRAPAITELSTSPSSGFFSDIRDPKTCPVFDQTNPNCAVSLPATFTSNPGLQPEKSKNLTAGVIFEPLDNLSIAFDAFKIKQRNTITFLDPDYLLAHESQYPGLVIRNPDGTLNSLNLSYANLGQINIWGYDIDVKGSQNLGEIGKLGVALSFDHEPSFKEAPVPGAPLEQFAGTYTQPKNRTRLGFSFDRGPWSSSLTFNYTGSYSLRVHTRFGPLPVRRRAERIPVHDQVVPDDGSVRRLQGLQEPRAGADNQESRQSPGASGRESGHAVHVLQLRVPRRDGPLLPGQREVHVLVKRS